MQVSPYTSKLNHGNAYWMARIAQIVYTPISEENNAPDEAAILDNLKSEDAKFISVKGFDKNSAQAALIEHQDYLCMAFRGTDEIKDWLDNLNAFSEAHLFGEFHRGFWNSLEDVWQGMYATYQQKREQKARPLFITGHSLGGAMASIATAKFIHEDLPFTSVYTFGQPRAMDRKTAQVFNMESKSRYFRFHNNNDIVTRVPARLMGYSHIGSYLYISEEKEIHSDPGFWFRFVDAVDGAFSAAKEKGLDMVEDHGMQHYLKAVKAWNFDE